MPSSPLIIFEKGGFRVHHNDVRVFLSRYMAGLTDVQRQWVASALADHYLKPSSIVLAAHASLFSLLRSSGRERDWAKIFTVDWVLRQPHYHHPFLITGAQCESALRLGCQLQDWNTMLELNCATETLERWQECSESGHFRDSEAQSDQLIESPYFPPSELVVLPLVKWNLQELFQLLNDTSRILRANEQPRARALLENWFSGLTISEFGQHFLQRWR